MATIIQNLNSIITTKNELNSILQENGVDGGEIFSEYPEKFRTVISSGGGSDKVSYSYLEEKLSDYVSYSYLESKHYLDSIPNTYATYEAISGMGYLTSIPNDYPTYAAISEMSYATQSYVVDYVAEHGGGGSTVIDENIIPKENNTYTLGDASHLYSASYTKSTYFTNNTKIVGSSSDITFYTGGLSRVKINNNILRPDRSGVDLGSSSSVWATTYTSNLYTDTAYLQDTSYTKSIIPTETGTYTLGDANHLYDTTYTSKIQSAGTGLGIRLGNASRYAFYDGAFRATDSNRNLGSSQYKWAATYTSNIYADNAYISNYSNFLWTGTSAEYAALPDYTTYQIYMIKEG